MSSSFECATPQFDLTVAVINGSVKESLSIRNDYEARCSKSKTLTHVAQSPTCPK